MKPSTWVPLAILALIASAFGIYTALNQSGAMSEHITGEWTLIEASDSDGPIDTAPAAVVMTVDENSLSGQVCNHFGGDYSLSGATLTVGPLMTTEMFCSSPEGIMDFESRFVHALSVANTVRYEGTNLVLTGVDIRLVFAQSTPD